MKADATAAGPVEGTTCRRSIARRIAPSLMARPVASLFSVLDRSEHGSSFGKELAESPDSPIWPLAPPATSDADHRPGPTEYVRTSFISSPF